MAQTLEKLRFGCDECGYRTNIKNRLVDHVNRVHLKIDNDKRKAETSSQSTPKRINLSIEGKREILREYDLEN